MELLLLLLLLLSCTANGFFFRGGWGGISTTITHNTQKYTYHKNNKGHITHNDTTQRKSTAILVTGRGGLWGCDYI
jgi:hypothetical protein